MEGRIGIRTTDGDVYKDGWIAVIELPWSLFLPAFLFLYFCCGH